MAKTTDDNLPSDFMRKLHESRIRERHEREALKRKINEEQSTLALQMHLNAEREPFCCAYCSASQVEVTRVQNLTNDHLIDVVVYCCSCRQEDWVCVDRRLLARLIKFFSRRFDAKS